MNIMPYELTRVCLQPIRGVEGSDYINASFLDGYRLACLYLPIALSGCLGLCLASWGYHRVGPAQKVRVGFPEEG